MKSVVVHDAQVGMVLARPILDGQGRTIICEGTVLTQLHVSRLAKWGVRELLITSDGEAATDRNEVATHAQTDVLDGSPATDLAAATPKKQLPGTVYGPDLPDRIDRTFASVKDQPLMAALRLTVIRLLLGHPNERARP